MPISEHQFIEMAGRVAHNRRVKVDIPDDSPELESALREQIDDYCKAQWPRWIVMAARTDKRSTINRGAHDLTIFANNGRMFLFELKSRTGKQSTHQIGWAMMMEQLGHKVLVIRSMTEFLEAIK